MTTAAGYFRIKRQTGNTQWRYPAGTFVNNPPDNTLFPDILDYGCVIYADPTGTTGTGIPNGSYGYSEATLEFPPLTVNEWKSIIGWSIGLFNGIASTMPYCAVEVELQERRGYGWETWTGYAWWPTGGKVANIGDGTLAYWDVKMRITYMVAT